jgi:VanZ family protein
MPQRLPLIGWVLFVLAVTVPWTTLRAHAHWSRVTWVPFQAGTVKPVDLAANLVLYLPLGWWWAHSARARPARQVLCAAVTAFLLSAACEWSQVYSHGRFPSATDVAANTSGAVLGVVLTMQRRRRGPPSDGAFHQ